MVVGVRHDGAAYVPQMQEGDRKVTPVKVNDGEVRPFYTPASLAKRLAVTERMVWKLIQQDELPSYKIGRTRRIDPVDVDAYLAARRES